jgi:hypothetical protein
LDEAVLIKRERDEQIRCVQKKYANLDISWHIDGTCELKGWITFVAKFKGTKIKDAYKVCILIFSDYPRTIPQVWETKGRIKETFHRNPNKMLCLGTPTELRLVIAECQTILEFIERVVVCYLFGHSYWERTGKMPFGERRHGVRGELDFYREFFNVDNDDKGIRLLAYLAKGKRYSRNKWCPCDSSRRIRICHGRKILLI